MEKVKLTSAERSREWRKHNKDKTRENSRRSREHNKEKNKLWQKKYRDSHKVERNKYNNEYQKRPDRRLYKRTICAAYNARKRGSLQQHTKEDILDLLKKQNNICNGCFKILEKFHVDHVIPLSRGGSNGPENLQILCPACNQSKNAKTMEEWLQIKQRTLAA